MDNIEIPNDPQDDEDIETGDGLILFFILAFLISWLFWALPLLHSMPQFNLPPIALFSGSLAVFGPALAAFAITAMDEGMEGVVRLLKKAIDLNFGVKWLLPIIFLFPLIFGLAYGLGSLLGSPMPNLIFKPFLIIGVFFSLLFLQGAVGEEFGWRGYALPRLQSRFNATVSGLILGVIWSLWHLPLFFITGSELNDISPLLFVLITTAASLLFTWIYNNANGSLFAALIFYTMYKLPLFLPLHRYNPIGKTLILVFMVGVVATIIVRLGQENLSKKERTVYSDD